MERKIKEVLKKVFGYEKFRENQKEIILNILKKRDVLAVMPTGLGNFMFSNSCNFRGWRYFWVNLKIKPKREAELERKIKEVLKKVLV